MPTVQWTSSTANILRQYLSKQAQVDDVLVTGAVSPAQETSTKAPKRPAKSFDNLYDDAADDLPDTSDVEAAEEYMDDKTAAATPEQQEKVHTVMSEYKHGELHSGSKKGPKVKSRAQAIAIALSEAGLDKQEEKTAAAYRMGDPGQARPTTQQPAVSASPQEIAAIKNKWQNFRTQNNLRSPLPFVEQAAVRPGNVAANTQVARFNHLVDQPITPTGDNRSASEILIAREQRLAQEAAAAGRPAPAQPVSRMAAASHATAPSYADESMRTRQAILDTLRKQGYSPEQQKALMARVDKQYGSYDQKGAAGLKQALQNLQGNIARAAVGRVDQRPVTAAQQKVAADVRDFGKLPMRPAMSTTQQQMLDLIRKMPGGYIAPDASTMAKMQSPPPPVPQPKAVPPQTAAAPETKQYWAQRLKAMRVRRGE